MHDGTGFTHDQIVELCVRVRAAHRADAQWSWPPILGLFRSIVVTLTYLRRNRVQAAIAEAFVVSQPTISRTVTALVPVLGAVLSDWVPVAEDLQRGTGYVVDGTLLPCWSWAGQRQLFSGKHRTTGLNVQLVCDLNGRLVWTRIRSMDAVTTAPHWQAPVSCRPWTQRPGRATRGISGLASSRRLPETTAHLPHHDLDGHRPTLLPRSLNKPHGAVSSGHRTCQ